MPWPVKVQCFLILLLQNLLFSSLFFVPFFFLFAFVNIFFFSTYSLRIVQGSGNIKMTEPYFFSKLFLLSSQSYSILLYPFFPPFFCPFLSYTLYSQWNQEWFCYLIIWDNNLVRGAGVNIKASFKAA